MTILPLNRAWVKTIPQMSFLSMYKLVLSFAFTLLFSCSVIAHESNDFWVLTNPNPPLINLDERGQLGGFLVDEVNGILDSVGIQQTILSAPWERLEREAKIKSNVLAFALTRTPEREPNYYWITPLTASKYAVFSLEESPFSITNIEQLSELDSIAVLRGDVRHQILLAHGLENIHVYTSWAEAIHGVLSGKSSAVFSSETGIQHFCLTESKDCDQFKHVFVYKKTMTYLTLSKVGTDVELAEKLISAAERFKQSAKFREISEYWLEQYKHLPIPMHMEDGILNLWKNNRTVP